MNRRTAFATAAMAALFVITATIAVASAADLPMLGFGSHKTPTKVEVTSSNATDETDAETSTTTTMKPIVVEQVVYEDSYMYVPRPTAAAAASAESTPAQAPTTPSTTAKPTTTTRPTTSSSSTTSSTTRATSTTTSRPPVPAGCQEPEWDREHQRWHCKGD